MTVIHSGSDSRYKVSLVLIYTDGDTSFEGTLIFNLLASSLIEASTKTIAILFQTMPPSKEVGFRITDLDVIRE